MSKKIILTEKAPAPIGPYSQAVLVGNTLYVSGQIAIDPKNGELINENIEKETVMVLENMKNILSAAGFDMTEVVKCTIFVSDMGNFQKINAVYGEYFPQNSPARETVEVSRLPKDVNVEISCIAIKS
jgi:2-iminobutanoate/2-iminopropanoate deaminase